MKLDSTTLIRAADSLYEKALDGIPGFSSVEEMAQEYRQGPESLEDQVDTLVRYQVAKASASGFLTGVGGVLTLPVTIPANLSSVMYVQLRMIAAIACMSGHDVRNDRVKTLCYVCLCGNAAKDVLKGVGITLGTKLSEQAIKQLSFEIIKQVNRAVGFRLVTKFGQTGVINLGKAVPLVGGVVGGTFDGASTYTIGKVAKNLFLAGAEAPNARYSTGTQQASVSNSSTGVLPLDEKFRSLPER